MSVINKSILRSGPVVCAVEKYYLIMIPVNSDVLMSVTVNGKKYYDHSNGVRRSSVPVQKFIIPMQELNTAKEYTVIYSKVIQRLPYSCLKGPSVKKNYKFRPIEKNENINIFLMSDCHGIKKEAVAAGRYFRNELDLLVLNGDISSSCMSLNEALLPYDIAFGITKGEIPCIITRGNHDLRGTYSEKLEQLMPVHKNRMYYEVCLGALWFLVLDCGEDKNDSNREYSGTAAFHEMRLEETEYIKALLKSKSESFRAENKYRIVISHIPFVYRPGKVDNANPFCIEDAIYTEWTALLNNYVHPTLCLAGHEHKNCIWNIDSEENSRKLNCPVVVTGIPHHGKHANTEAAAIMLEKDRTVIVFTDKDKQANETVII